MIPAIRHLTMRFCYLSLLMMLFGLGAAPAVAQFVAATGPSAGGIEHVLLAVEVEDAYVPGAADRPDAAAPRAAGSPPVTTRPRLTASLATTEPADVPQTVTVQPAYPNPFQTITTLTFALPQPGPVRVEAFDLLGRRVAMLLDRPLPAGEHRVRFDASDQPPGIYLLRITAGETVHTQRVVRMR